MPPTAARSTPPRFPGGAAAAAAVILAVAAAAGARPAGAAAPLGDTSAPPPAAGGGAPAAGPAAPGRASQPADVTAGGVVLFRIRAASGGRTPRQRADTVQGRLVEILSEPDLNPRDVRVAASGRNEAQILVRSRLLVTATAEDGRANGKTAMGQASAWADGLRAALPGLSVKPNANDGAPAPTPTPAAPAAQP